MNYNKLYKLKIFATCIFVIGFLCVFAFLFYDLYNPILDFIKDPNHNREPIKEIFEGYGFWKYLIVAIIQALQIVLSVIPSEPVILISMFTCGVIFGFTSCLVGCVIGNLLIYFIVKLTKVDTTEFKNNKKKEKYDTIDSATNSKNVIFVILGMYLMPAIPYGMIAIAAAKKLKFTNYLLVTTIGVIPSIVMTLAFGKIIFRPDLLISGIVIALTCLVIFIITKMKKQILQYLSNRSIRSTLIWFVPLCGLILSLFTALIMKNPKLELILLLTTLCYFLLYLLFNTKTSHLFRRYTIKDFQKEPKKPNKLLYNILIFFMRKYFYKKFNVKIDYSEIPNIEKPSIICYNHPSKLDFFYAYTPFKGVKPNSVIAYYYFCYYVLGRLLRTLGGFPKYLYQPDINAIKNIKKVINNKGVIGIAPEGRLSAYGELESYIPSTAKLIKKLGVEVTVVKINGAYLSWPKWAKYKKRGLVEIKPKKVLTKEQIGAMSVEEIYNKLYDELYYNDFDWQKEKHIEFKGKGFSEGLEHILYKCPVCHKEYTFTSKNDILTCSSCNTKVKLNTYYEFESDSPLIPKNIRDWYLWQKTVENEAIQDPDYSLFSKVTLKHPDPKGYGFVVVGEGYTTLTHKGVLYKGTINGEEKEILFKIENVHAIPFGVNEDFEIYHHNTLYYFIPENIRSCVKWSVVGELIYKKYVIDNNINILE